LSLAETNPVVAMIRTATNVKMPIAFKNVLRLIEFPPLLVKYPCCYSSDDHQNKVPLPDAYHLLKILDFRFWISDCRHRFTPSLYKSDRIP
jgi:hypothetical protein